MGNGFFAEADSRRIADLATEINAQFSKDFSIAFKDNIVNNIKGAYLEGNVSKNELMQYDNPSQDIKRGYLLKIGGNVKSWKNRYFVAKNKSENYAIIYYEDETMRKEKGRFCCCGYQVEAFSAEEISWYGVYGIKLTSYDDSKRQWLFRARSDPEQSAWLEVLMNACKKAKPEPLKEAIYTSTFRTAFSATKAAYGYYGVCYIFGSEVEMLEHLTKQILNREILDEYIIEYMKKTTHPNKTILLDIHRHVQKIILPIIQVSWNNCYNAIRVLKAPFELSVKASLRQLLQKETEIRQLLEPKLREIVVPYLSELDELICMPILHSCCEPMLQSYERALQGLYMELLRLCHSVEPYVHTVRTAQLALLYNIDTGCVSSTSPLAASQRVLWTMHTEDLIDLQEVFEVSGITGFDVYSTALDDLKQLTQNALYTFGAIVIPTSSTNSGSGSGSNSPNSSSSRQNSPGRDASDSTSTTGTPPPPPLLPDESSPSPTTMNTKHNAKLTADRERARSYHSNHDDHHSHRHGRSRSKSHNRSSKVPISRSTLFKALQQVSIRMTKDSVLSIQARLIQLLVDALEARIQESMISPSTHIVRTLQREYMVTKELQLIVNIHNISEMAIREMIRDMVQNSVNKHLTDITTRMQEMCERLCEENPAPVEEI